MVPLDVMKELNGREIADFVKERQAKQVRALRQSWKVIPKLVIVQTIDDPVIDTYVRLKKQYAEDILVDFELRKIEQSDALDTIARLNEDESVHGIIVQLPLTDTSQTDAIVAAVAPKKDVDGLGSTEFFDPATPLAINWLLAAYNIELENRPLAIVGRGRLVGAPLEKMWRNSDYNVTVFDDETGDLSTELRHFPVIVTATGVPHLIMTTMVQPGAVIVDAGTASEGGAIVGDVDDAVRERDDITMTPIKGGVGPLTIAALIDNVITAARHVADAQGQKDL